MGIGGSLQMSRRTVEASLVKAYTGITRYTRTEWVTCCSQYWVLDYFNQGRQEQQAGSASPHERHSGVGALYAPTTPYHEFHLSAQPVDESYVLFEAHGNTAKELRRIVDRDGVCYVQDPRHLLKDLLRRAGESLFYRRPGFGYFAHSILCEVLGLLLCAESTGPRLRSLAHPASKQAGIGLAGTVERYVRDRLPAHIRVEDLAAHVGLSTSAFAHTYRRQAGETPYRTVMRLRVEAAKSRMLQDGLSVQEASVDSGFSSPYHFSRVFKRLEGLPPRRYVRMLRDKAVR